MKNLSPESLLHGEGKDFILVNSATNYYSTNDEKLGEEVLPPLGLALLLTYALQQEGINGSLLDMEEYRLTIKKTADIINNFPSTKVGMNLLTPSRQVALAVAGELDRDKELILGGPHVTALPEHTLREFVNLHRNTVILPGSVGNVEDSFVSYMRSGKPFKDIPGIQWMREGKVERSVTPVIHRHFNYFPNIDRTFVAPVYRDHRNDRLEAAQITSVNCPFNCSFCNGASSRFGPRTERRTTIQIVEEISNLISQHNAENIRFVDDLLLSSIKSIEDLLNAIEKSGLPSFKIRGNGHVRTLTRMGKSYIYRLAQSRFDEIAVGIESASPNILKKMRKPHTPDEAVSAIRTLNTAGINTKGYFIIGYPGEIKEETWATVNMAMKLREESMGMHRNSLFNFFIHPGTDAWDSALRRGWSMDKLLASDFTFKDGRTENNGRPIAHLAELLPQDLQRIAKDYHEWQLVH